MLNKDSLRAGATRAVDIYLPTQSAPSAGTPQVLRIVPNWLTSTSSLRIWASYRTREGGDDEMGTTLSGKVHIYTGSINAANEWVVTNWEASLTRAWGWGGWWVVGCCMNRAECARVCCQCCTHRLAQRLPACLCSSV